MSLKNALDDFYYDVIEGAKKILVKKNKNASKALSNSLDYSVKVTKNGFSSSLSMEDYGEFVDKGVKGAGGTKADGSKWKLKRVVKSPYKYTNKRPPTKVFDKWIVRRGIAPRDKSGKFTSREDLKKAIAKSVYHTGLETTNFLTTPFNREFKKLPDAIVEAYGLEIEDFFKFSLK